MSHRSRTRWIEGAGVALCAALLGALAGGGCELRSSSTVARRTLAIAGLYRDADEGRIVDRNSGAAVLTLFLRQLGDAVEGVDNNGRVFRGTFTAESDTGGTLELRGDTTTGVPVTISGTILIVGGTAYLGGTWIEPGLYGTVSAEAEVVTAPDPDPTPTNTTANVTL